MNNLKKSQSNKKNNSFLMTKTDDTKETQKMNAMKIKKRETGNLRG